MSPKMAADSQTTTSETFRLFDDNKSGNLGLGFFYSPLTPPPPPPPTIEVLPSQGSGSSSVKYSVDEVDLGFVTLLKGRVSTKEVFALSNSDLIPGKYEGGLKLWEGSLDLVKALNSDIEKGNLSVEGKRVLELGCGHGLPGIFACLKGAAATHFQDFNAEVLRCLTIPNVNANLPSENGDSDKDGIRYFAGDWSEMDRILPYAYSDRKDAVQCANDTAAGGYDLILMAETVYSISVLHNLYDLIKKCISHPHGVVYMAAKKHYFGVGGGSRQFVSIVEKDGMMVASQIAEIVDGASNLREVWKLSCK